MAKDQTGRDPDSQGGRRDSAAAAVNDNRSVLLIPTSQMMISVVKWGPEEGEGGGVQCVGSSAPYSSTLASDDDSSDSFVTVTLRYVGERAPGESRGGQSPERLLSATAIGGGGGDATVMRGSHPRPGKEEWIGAAPAVHCCVDRPRSLRGAGSPSLRSCCCCCCYSVAAAAPLCMRYAYAAPRGHVPLVPVHQMTSSGHIPIIQPTEIPTTAPAARAPASPWGKTRKPQHGKRQSAFWREKRAGRASGGGRKRQLAPARGKLEKGGRKRRSEERPGGVGRMRGS